MAGVKVISCVGESEYIKTKGSSTKLVYSSETAADGFRYYFICVGVYVSSDHYTDCPNIFN